MRPTFDLNSTFDLNRIDYRVILLYVGFLGLESISVVTLILNGGNQGQIKVNQGQISDLRFIFTSIQFFIWMILGSCNTYCC